MAAVSLYDIISQCGDSLGGGSLDVWHRVVNHLFVERSTQHHIIFDVLFFDMKIREVLVECLADLYIHFTRFHVLLFEIVFLNVESWRVGSVTVYSHNVYSEV